MSAVVPDPWPTAPDVKALQAALAASHFERVALDGPAMFRAARDGGEWAKASDAALAVGRACSNLMRTDEALRWTQEAAQAAQRQGDAERECMAWGQLAAEHARHDHLAPALAALDEMERRLGEVLREPARLGLLTSIATTFYGLGLTGPALHAYARALATAERLGDPGQVVTLRTNWLVVARSHQVAQSDQDAEAAAALLARREQELSLLEPAVAQLAAPRAHWRLAHVRAGVHADAGRHAQAADVLRQLLDTASTLPPVLLSSLWLDLAKSLQAAGDDEPARQAVRQAAVYTERSSPLPRSYDLHRRAELAELLGQPEAALAFYKQYHHRVRSVLTAAIESRLAGSLARLAAMDTEAENQRLKAQNRGLAEGVARLGALAVTDPLTELLNRRGFDEHLARLDEQGTPAVVALIDIDRFKAVNDRHGHAQGDEVLRRVARCLSSVIRPQDLLARQGGEEFVVLLHQVQPAPALAMLDRLRGAVAAHDWSALSEGLKVTVSVGATARRADELFPAAMARADRLLYQAKEGGRDRVVAVFDEGGAGEAWT